MTEAEKRVVEAAYAISAALRDWEVTSPHAHEELAEDDERHRRLQNEMDFARMDLFKERHPEQCGSRQFTEPSKQAWCDLRGLEIRDEAVFALNRIRKSETLKKYESLFVEGDLTASFVASATEHELLEYARKWGGP